MLTLTGDGRLLKMAVPPPLRLVEVFEKPRRRSHQPERLCTADADAVQAAS
jgi:hypothetical protein